MGAASVKSAPGEAEIGFEPERSVAEKSADADHLNQSGHEPLHASYSFRTPASLQPYLEDDVDEAAEGSEVITGATSLGDEPPGHSQSYPDKAVSVDQGSPLKQQSHDEDGAVQKDTSAPADIGDEVQRSGGSTSKKANEVGQVSAGETQKGAAPSRPVSQSDTTQHQHHRDATEPPVPPMEMQERRRSRLSQAYASPEDSAYADTSENFSRTFTPPIGPLSTMPSNTPPQFMSPMPVRAAYPSHERFAVHGGSSTYPPGHYGLRPLAIGSDRANPYSVHMPHYMDHMAQGPAPMPFGQPREFNSSYRQDELQVISPSSMNPAEATYDPTSGLLARVESALPDIHQLIYRHREVSSQMNIQISTFRNADAQKNELLREKDHLIDSLTMQLQEHHHQHMHERSLLEMKLRHLKEEQRGLKDKVTRHQVSEPAIVERGEDNTAQAASKSEPEAERGQLAKLHGNPPVESNDIQKASGLPDQALARSDPVDTITGQVSQGARDVPQQFAEGIAPSPAESVVATKGCATMPEAHTDAAGDGQQPGEPRDKRPVIKRTRTHLIDVDDLEEGEKIEVEMASDQEPDAPTKDTNEALVLENSKLRDDLKSVQSSWATDKAELVETHRRLELAAIKLGIENVKQTLSLHMVHD